MTQKLKLTQIGNSIGIVLPKDLLAKLRVGKGDSITVTETPDGLQLSPWDEVKQSQLEAAERVMRKNRNMLRKLAQ
ncbi:AbrB/MazE/SpoVT family DNA-binding domain-containing protein [bacterium]|jgi:putative addiction module antidote|nr:AbrB/MazE/SpoVT family DNA-binding domain-containing protein [Verrucomicrobiota bacterium]MDA7633298.1 AbrB/MazE/SpoVT family DNA-binding domain-containing protein [bacterium]MDA7867334.1 AbrB/MazE/SpoVT family DNA-binding domain-containing protein [Verrucomicrobiota bacterium]MDB4798635.1 AbrB/MazE/SpoVT family DNA-binding domain-containing protein [Verrucomicrobiota bacterium]